MLKLRIYYNFSLDDDESIRLSNRVLAKAEGHIEASSDLDDQGIFLFRKDMVQWIVHSPDDKHWMSIRDDLIPELMKCQYKPFSGKKIDNFFLKKTMKMTSRSSRSLNFSLLLMNLEQRDLTLWSI